MDDATSWEVHHDSLAEIALGVLDPAEVTGLEAHLEDCPGCRAELVELAASADRLVLLAPAVDPPARFERRAVAAMTGGHSSSRSTSRLHRRRARVVLAVAAALAVVAGIGAVVHVMTGSDRPAALAAPLVTQDGRSVGRVVVHDAAPRTMSVSLDGVERGVRYRCELVLPDGSRHEVGTWTTWSTDDTWSVSVPDQPARRVEIRRDDGRTVARADLGD